MRAHAVYCYFNKQNQLLYVGMSQVLATRFYAHERNSAWITQASEILVFWYKTRAQAQAVEQEAISYFRPPHNRMPDEIGDTQKIAKAKQFARAQVWREKHKYVGSGRKRS